MNSSSEGHLDGSRVAAYLDDRLDDTERRRVESHLEQCDFCRAEVVEVSRMLGAERQPAAGGPLRRLAPVGVLAAAALLFAMLLQPWGDSVADRPAADARVRVAGEGIAAVQVIAPEPGASIGASEKFVWRAPVADALYRYRVIDASGRVQATVTTQDTVVQLPADVPLRSGALYFWYVDALLPDGRSATTGHQEIRFER